MMHWLIALIPLAAWSGWWLALRHESRQARQHALRNTYLEGLNALLHDQTDHALESFIQLSNLDEQTLDTQHTLAKLFRKRGELDRALHLHQQLLDQPLSAAQKHATQLELAHDYAQVGMYREAVWLYEQALQRQLNASEQRAIVLALLKLYERLNAWQAAIVLLHHSLHDDDRERLAHYHVELAQSALAQQDLARANLELQSALHHAPNHIRAHWLRAELALQHHEPINAIHDLHHIAEHQSAFLPELLPLLQQAYQALGQREAYERWLLEQEAKHKNPRLTLAVVQHLYLNDPRGKALLQQRLQEQQSALLLSSWWQEQSALTGLELSWLSQALKPKTVYQCQCCGFRQQKLRWYCPSCRSWHSYQPLLMLHQEYKSP